MPQKLCATCNKELTATERALNEIQCTHCYQQWLDQSVAQAEPAIRRLLAEIEQEKMASALRRG